MELEYETGFQFISATTTGATHFELDLLFSCTGFLSLSTRCKIDQKAEPACLRNAFSDVVLVIVYNHPFYWSIPSLTELYKNAFPTMMICGPNEAKNHTVEALHIHKGYFAYLCMSRAVEKHPGYSGYLLINDDLMLNYWNLIGLKRDRIWEGPKDPINFQNYSLHDKWYWWNSSWGMSTCQKAYDEIWVMRENNLYEWLPEVINEHADEQTHPQNRLSSMKLAADLLQKNGNGTSYCFHGRSDIFYIPQKFAETFRILSYVFYKHGTFLEIAVPTMCRMLDRVDNFEYIPGIYLPGRIGEPPVRKAQHFWELYNKTLAFVHPLKLNYTGDGALNSILLRSFIIEYSNTLSDCEPN